MSEDEASFFDLLLELFVGVYLDGMCRTVVEGLLVDVLLYLIEELDEVVADAIEGAGLLGQCITASYFDSAVLEVTARQPDGWVPP